MPIRYSEQEILDKAVQLGLVEDGQPLPRHLRGRVVAALVAADAAPRPQTVQPRLASQIVVQPGGDILVDGQPFPWLVGKDPMDIHLAPGGISTVRLTLLASAIQIIPPEPRPESET